MQRACRACAEKARDVATGNWKKEVCRSFASYAEAIYSTAGIRDAVASAALSRFSRAFRRSQDYSTPTRIAGVCNMAGITQEQVKTFALQTWEGTKANVAVLSDAGLFKMDHAVAFAKELALPFAKENLSVPAIQSLLLARTDDLTKGFTIMNACALFLELLGNLTALMLGRTMFVFIFEFIWTFLVAYILYWLVVHAVSE